MNNKGFTMIEILGIVVILALISLIAVPSVNRILNKAKVKSINAQMSLLVDAARKWGINNPSSMPEYEKDSEGNFVGVSGPYALSLRSLLNVNYIDKDNIKDPETKKNYDPDNTYIIISLPSLVNGKPQYDSYEYCFSNSPTKEGNTKYLESEYSEVKYICEEKCSYTVNQVFNYTYNGVDGTNGSVQNVSLACAGSYKLEVWGASGGSSSSSGGYGGYSIGVYQATSNELLYVYVGGKPSSLTGGYNGGGTAVSSAFGGGGASDIRTSLALSSRIIVAGGGGGRGRDSSAYGGYGGGTTGSIGKAYSTAYTAGGGGTQSAGGLGGTKTSAHYPGDPGVLGIGGNSQITVQTGSGSSNTYGGGGGGGGYYGGGGGTTSGDSTGGGGGSGYIGGVTSANGVIAGTTAGNLSMLNPSGGTMTGNSGNGHARITYLGK